MPIDVTVLGSGGPFANPARASSSYLVELDGDRRLLVDAGGGALGRLGQLRIDPVTIELVLVTHTYIDHTGGLAPVVFAAYLGGRTRHLRLVDPAGRERHPGADRFSELLFGEQGPWSDLHSFEGFGIDTREVPNYRSGIRCRPSRASCAR
jgi:ribonuclease BN (tRNA processing enzyme)